MFTLKVAHSRPSQDPVQCSGGKYTEREEVASWLVGASALMEGTSVQATLASSVTGQGRPEDVVDK